METKYISFGGKNYILDINKIIEFCLGGGKLEKSLYPRNKRLLSDFHVFH